MAYESRINLDELNSEAFVKRAKSLDPNAFDQLCECILPRLVRYLVHVREIDRADAEEIASDTLLKVHKGLPTFNYNGGAVTYTYNQLSRLTAESRHFFGSIVGGGLQQAPGGVGVFNIAYSYDLGGGLKSITDPYGQSTYYNLNEIGQTVAINGSWFAGGNHIYATNTKYRAWGAVKSIDYVNNSGTSRETFTYNNRLLADTYSLYHFSNGQTIVQKQYQYYNDGLLKYTKDGPVNGTGTAFDRSYKFDHVGRLYDARSGSEARGGNVPDPSERLYANRQTFDVWGNAISTTMDQWSTGAPTLTKSIVNNRITDSGFAYDSDGRMTSGDAMQYRFDATGNTYEVESTNVYKLNRSSDGDGRVLREHVSDFVYDTSFPNGHWVGRPSAKYYIRATALNGDVIAESLGDGRKDIGYVYGFGRVVGTQNKYYTYTGPGYLPEVISWDYVDASNTTIRSSNHIQTLPGVLTGYHELDPLNNDVGISAPQPSGGGGGPEPWNYPRYGGSYDGGYCTVDGIEMSCNLVMGMLQSGAGVQCPDNYCGSVSINVYGTSGSYLTTFTASFNANAAVDGYGFPAGSGYLPLGTTYQGGGMFSGGGQTVTATAFYAIVYETLGVLGGLGPGQGAQVLDRGSVAQTNSNGNGNFTHIDSAVSERIIKEVTTQAKEILKALPKCRQMLSSSAIDALDALEALLKPGIGTTGILNMANSTYGNTIAWTRSSHQAYSRGAMYLYNMFFTANFGFKIGDTSIDAEQFTPEQRRMLVFLHELGHLTRKWIHGDEGGLLQTHGSVPFFEHNWNQWKVNTAVWEACFQQPAGKKNPFKITPRSGFPWPR